MTEEETELEDEEAEVEVEEEDYVMEVEDEYVSSRVTGLRCIRVVVWLANSSCIFQSLTCLNFPQDEALLEEEEVADEYAEVRSGNTCHGGVMMR